MKTIVQNLAVEYDDQGSGPVVLMLHGWKDSLRTFDALIPYLAKHRIVRLDLPGFGGSEMPRNTWNIAAYVDFVRSFVEKMNLQVDTIVGHSFGGRIAIRGVGSRILKPKRMVLIAAAGLAKRRTLRNQLLGAMAKIGRFVTMVPPFSLWRNQLRQALYESIGSDYFTAGALKDTFVSVVAENLSEFASKITVPTLIVWGKNDTTTPLEQAIRIKELVHGSTLRVVDTAGHFVHREMSGEVAKSIEEFLV
ncbi:alpha/beta hydrolase [Candidatus Kaiserbacteria bacterium]|nr:alpha/beta hydrolase [Candidatus Kaiserbacteria bacterium]